MQRFYADERRRVDARLSEIGELLCEDTRAAESDEKGGRRECGGARFGEGRTAVRGFQKTDGEARSEGCAERRKDFFEEKCERCEQFQVREHFCQDEKEGDESADRKNGEYGAVDAFAEDIVCVGKRRQGGAGAFFFSESCEDQGDEKDGGEMGKEQCISEGPVFKHGRSHASDDEHGARSGAERGDGERFGSVDKAVVCEVFEQPASDGITRDGADEKAVGRDARHAEYVAHEGGKAQGGFGNKAEFREHGGKDEEGKEGRHDEIQP